MASASYNFVQSTASNTWIIPHNLNSSNVVIDVYINNGGTIEKIIPLNIQVTDVNTITVTFSSAQIGYARLAI